jgi:hypothetical protein
VKAYVYLGPTLCVERARTHLDAHYLPPVQQGDIIRLLAKKPRVIAIIDGLFGAVPAVWHKEILAALEQGCHVFGASSMGALRAAELHPFGMRGVGQIFEHFCDGTFEDDDEVAVSHSSEEFGFRELSVAMVNVRDMLQAAEREGVLDAADAQALTVRAKSRFYRDRTLQGLLAEAKRWGWPDAKLRQVDDFFQNFGPMAKERDAVRLLEQVGEFLATDPPPFRASEELERTLFLVELRREVELQKTPRRIFEDDASVAATGLPLWALRKEALIQILARNARARLELEVTDDELESAWQQLRQGAGWADEEQAAAGLARCGISTEETTSTLRDIVGLTKVEMHFKPRIDLELPNLAAVLAAVRGKA